MSRREKSTALRCACIRPTARYDRWVWRPAEESDQRSRVYGTDRVCGAVREKALGEMLSRPLRRLGATTLCLPAARCRNSFRPTLRTNGTANIGLASLRLVASDRQVWYPRLGECRGRQPSPPPPSPSCFSISGCCALSDGGELFPQALRRQHFNLVAEAQQPPAQFQRVLHLGL